jgi:hypothetical protein
MPHIDADERRAYARVYYRNHYRANKEKYKEASRKWRLNNLNHVLWRTAKNRARLKGMEFNIDVEDIIIPSECPILGIKLVSGAARKSGGNTNNSPSIDRIDSRKGYIKGNVQVISVRANWLKNNATTEELRRLANYMTRLEGRLL